MANVKFSGLPAASTVLPADIFCITQGGASKQSSLGNLWEATAVGNANYTILATDRLVYNSVAFTAPRTWTLPSAASYGAGRTLTIIDAIGTVTTTNTLTIARAGSDTINGLASIVLATAYQSAILVSDGVLHWTLAVPTSTGALICEPGTGNPLAGDLGEYIESIIGAGSPVSVTTSNAIQNITTISLSPGDWDVSAMVGIVGVAATFTTGFDGGVSLVNGTTLDGITSVKIRWPSWQSGAAFMNGTIPRTRYSIASTQTVYLNTRVVFTASTMSAYGTVNARRVR
jgi:hypothetical protein